MVCLYICSVPHNQARSLHTRHNPANVQDPRAQCAHSGLLPVRALRGRSEVQRHSGHAAGSLHCRMFFVHHSLKGNLYLLSDTLSITRSRFTYRTLNPNTAAQSTLQRGSTAEHLQHLHAVDDIAAVQRSLFGTGLSDVRGQLADACARGTRQAQY